MVGNIAPDGSASFFDVLFKLADLTRARHYPMPLPVFASTEAERDLLLAMKPVRNVDGLAAEADVMFVGVGQISQPRRCTRTGSSRATRCSS